MGVGNPHHWHTTTHHLPPQHAPGEMPRQDGHLNVQLVHILNEMENALSSRRPAKRRRLALHDVRTCVRHVEQQRARIWFWFGHLRVRAHAVCATHAD